MSIPVFPADVTLSSFNEALEDVGCAVITDVMDPALRQSITDELAPHMAAARVIDEDDPKEFYPGRTRRVTALIARSPTVTDRLIPHPITKEVCEHFLLPTGEFGYQLHVTAALDVGPGARRQILHREDDSFAFFPMPRPNLIIATMWAISDFRADNGGTLLVPGSHKWPGDRVAKPEEIVEAEMPAGSVLFWHGSLLHGAGANVAEDWRYGVILTYSAGWVRQEENQYLDVSAERLAELSPEVRRIAGFDMYGALGFYDPSAP